MLDLDRMLGPLEIAAGGFGPAYDKPKKSGPCGLGLCGIGLNAGWAAG